MVLLIALVPAVVVILIAVGTKSKTKTTVVALIVAALGIFTGNPAYTALDVVAVALAYWLAMSFLGNTIKPAEPPVVFPTAPPIPNVKESDSGSLSPVAVIAALGVFGYLYLSPGSHKPPNQQPPPANTQPVVSVSRPYIAPQPASSPLPVVAKKQSKRSPKSPLQRCMEIRSEDMMAACLERLE